MAWLRVTVSALLLLMSSTAMAVIPLDRLYVLEQIAWLMAQEIQRGQLWEKDPKFPFNSSAYILTQNVSAEEYAKICSILNKQHGIAKPPYLSAKEYEPRLKKLGISLIDRLPDQDKKILQVYGLRYFIRRLLQATMQPKAKEYEAWRKARADKTTIPRCEISVQPPAWTRIASRKIDLNSRVINVDDALALMASVPSGQKILETFLPRYRSGGVAMRGTVEKVLGGALGVFTSNEDRSKTLISVHARTEEQLGMFSIVLFHEMVHSETADQLTAEDLEYASVEDDLYYAVRTNGRKMCLLGEKKGLVQEQEEVRTRPELNQAVDAFREITHVLRNHYELPAYANEDHFESELTEKYPCFYAYREAVQNKFPGLYRSSWGLTSESFSDINRDTVENDLDTHMKEEGFVYEPFKGEYIYDPQKIEIDELLSRLAQTAE